jgi:hypothetical protein
MHTRILIFLTICCVGELLFTRERDSSAFPLSLMTEAYAESPSVEKTWKTIDELSPEERQQIDLSENTPRNTQIPYLPAEAYPFQPPYTAEEMGYRLMEFSQRPRWSCMFANLWGSISPQGVFMNPGKSITFMNYAEPVGVGAELVRKPGEELYRYLNQNVSPPDAEGSQRMTIRYRTDQGFTKKEESFMYTPSIRRVRHQAPNRRQDKFPNQAQTTDDSTGRDAWEFSWRLVGTDVLHQTVRFPVTRPTVVIGNLNDGMLREVKVSDLKLMGDAYPYYTADGGVECYVVEAKARDEWIPNYYAPRILYWLEKHSFYPLRVEQYGRDGKLAFIEARMTTMFNPTLAERGYGPLLIVYWDIASDTLTYSVRDNHHLKQWTAEEQQFFFNPDFMRRQWYLDLTVKSQMDVVEPSQFYLRPSLDEGTFPNERPMQIPAEVTARVQAQEAAGRLVFEVNTPLPVTITADQPKAPPQINKVKAPEHVTSGESPDEYAQHAGHETPTALR